MNLKPNQLFLVSKYKTQARYFETQELREVLEALIDLDANYKIGLISLEKGMEDIKAGRVYSADEVEAEMKREFGIHKQLSQTEDVSVN